MKPPMIKIDPVPFTQEGYNKLLEEKEKLLQERPVAVEHLKKSRELGDLSENGYYKSSRQKLNSIDARMRYLNHMIKYATIIEKSHSDVVELGSTVTLYDGKEKITYTIVGGEESNPSQGTISYKSPLGKAVLGKRTGEVITLALPSTSVVYKVINIS